MTQYDQPLTIGIEEEYLLVDPETRDLVSDPPRDLLDDCKKRIGADVGNVTPEFLKAQIEVDTSVCGTLAECRQKLATLRRCTAEAAERHGLRIIAASTHPFAEWTEQQHTDRTRYNLLAEDLQTVANRLLICGMHVHVGVDDDELRNDLLNQVSYFLPHMLALSTSSPFWQGRHTGLRSYRLSVFDELPRTGLPEKFDSFGEYTRHVDSLVSAGVIEDSSKIWWDIRPSARFPTLEVRICDICTRLDHGITIAAIYACLLSMLRRLRRDNQRWRVYANMLIQENRWRAQRYGTDEGLVDFGRGEIVPYNELLEEILGLLAEDAERLGCVDEINRARDILKDGSSAHRQVQVYEASLKAGADETEALSAVVDWLIEETLNGVEA